MSLPILSYATAHADPPEFIRQLRHALLTTGFLYLSSIEAVVPSWRASWDAAFAASGEFFAHDERTKVEGIGMARSRHFRGYSAVGVEVTQGRHDLREQIDLGPDTEPAVEYPPPPGTPVEVRRPPLPLPLSLSLRPPSSAQLTLARPRSAPSTARTSTPPSSPRSSPPCGTGTPSAPPSPRSSSPSSPSRSRPTRTASPTSSLPPQLARTSPPTRA